MQVFTSNSEALGNKQSPWSWFPSKRWADAFAWTSTETIKVLSTNFSLTATDTFMQMQKELLLGNKADAAS